MEEQSILEFQEFQEFQNRAIEEERDDIKSVVPPSDIVAFNEQRSCADIYRMYVRNQIDINPDFQRGEVWSNKSQTLFIDSLIKQLPIPSMCISLDFNTQKRLVIDGLQRITTIIKFLDESKDWKLSTTDDVDPRLSGRKVSSIKKDHMVLFETLENVTIPITVLRCNYDDKDHMKYLFQIFYRLNSGGNKLYNQEIRNCIYQGSFNSFLKSIVRQDAWLRFAHTDIDKVDKARFSNEERILRFIAFFDNYQEYKGKLADFLNDYMEDKRNISESEIEYYRKIVLSTLELALKINPKITSKNVADAFLVGLAKNIKTLQNLSSIELNNMYEKLSGEPEFSEEALQDGLGATEKVKSRIEKAIKIFGNG